jgi:uncharacterized protein
VHYRFIESINHIEPLRWNAVAGVDYPFLRHEFLQALENSGSVGAAQGWQPQHLLIEDSGELLAILPLYIKSHSYGEYVFDWSWAEAYQRHDIPYYPKLVSSIPFTPSTGPRLAVATNEISQVIATVTAALNEKAEEIGASGWHVLFPQDSEDNLWKSSGAQERLGCQFHWHNDSFGQFDDFLARFSSRKRKDVKKERQKVVAQGIRIERLTGDEILPEHWQCFYHFYRATYLKKSGHAGYLTPAFFALLHDTLRKQALLVLAYENGTAIAGGLYFFSADTLYGRYWGCIKDVPGLHFETCYYQGIEFCIERGLQRFDAGAQGEHKIQRGFEPVLTHSYHWIRHPGFRQAIADFLQDEAAGIKQYQEQAITFLPFRRPE